MTRRTTPNRRVVVSGSPSGRVIKAPAMARREELALAICDEAGKPISDARAEVDRAIFCFELAAHVRNGDELITIMTSLSIEILGEHLRFNRPA